MTALRPTAEVRKDAGKPSFATQTKAELDGMTIYSPGFLGIIARKSDRTGPFIKRCKEHAFALCRKSEPTLTREEFEQNLNQDEHLVGFSVAMNGMDLDKKIKELEDDGCVLGVDFVATSSPPGLLIQPIPAWLSSEARPTKRNTPELLATLDPWLRDQILAQPPQMDLFYTYQAVDTSRD